MQVFNPIKQVTFNVNEAKTTTKSKFIKLNADMYLNPNQVAMIVPTDDRKGSILVNNQTNKLVTITDCKPDEMVKYLNYIV